MKYIYIINGRADKAPAYQEFFDQLKEIPHLHEVYTTLGEGDATRYVRLYCDLHPEEEVCFVACGGNGIINGVASGGQSCIRPGSNATRAQFATIISRYARLG